MKALLVLILSVIGLARAEFDALCAASTGPLIPHPTECSKFIQCTNGIGTVHTCMDDKWFDADTLFCRPQSVANCEHVPSNEVPEYVLQICSNLAIGQTIPAVPCNKYYVCFGTRAFELSCPNGQHYSRAYTACMNPLEAGCRALNTMCVGEYPGFAFPALTCEQYYVCSSSLLPQLQTCDAGLYFSADLQGCTSPAASGCVNKQSTTPSPATTTPGGCGPTEPICNSTNTGLFYPHPECNWFYMCYDSTALEFQCECGQYFNPTLGYCIQDVDKVCLT